MEMKITRSKRLPSDATTEKSRSMYFFKNIDKIVDD